MIFKWTPVTVVQPSLIVSVITCERMNVGALGVCQAGWRPGPAARPSVFCVNRASSSSTRTIPTFLHLFLLTALLLNVTLSCEEMIEFAAKLTSRGLWEGGGAFYSARQCASPPTCT